MGSISVFLEQWFQSQAAVRSLAGREKEEEEEGEAAAASSLHCTASAQSWLGVNTIPAHLLSSLSPCFSLDGIYLTKKKKKFHREGNFMAASCKYFMVTIPVKGEELQV